MRVNRDRFFAMLEEGSIDNFTINGTTYTVKENVEDITEDTEVNEVVVFDVVIGGIDYQYLKTNIDSFDSIISEPEELDETGLLENGMVWSKGHTYFVFIVLDNEDLVEVNRLIERMSLEETTIYRFGGEEKE